MLALGWLAVLLSVFAILWADGGSFSILGVAVSQFAKSPR